MHHLINIFAQTDITPMLLSPWEQYGVLGGVITLLVGFNIVQWRERQKDLAYIREMDRNTITVMNDQAKLLESIKDELKDLPGAFHAKVDPKLDQLLRQVEENRRILDTK